MAIQSTSTIQQHNHISQSVQQKQEQYGQHSLVRSHPIALAMMIGMGILSLTACDPKNSDTNDTNTDAAAQVTKDGSDAESQGDDNAVAVTQSQQSPSIDSNSAVNNQEEQDVPVSYDVNNWQVGSDERYEVNELKKIQQALGSVVNSDKNSLDYTSNPAIKYRFMNEGQPYLDIIDSQQYLEFGWYYANPTDSDAEKQSSIEHAKKVYQIANNLMGAEGTSLVANILTGQIIKNKTVGGKKVELAKCEFYSCMIILAK
ncbi:hypothetical protein [Psychrobacter sp. I-STPA10]|uniref:hypothetical protein n=1 Tax=Psychrobacter sp. I-STPA10 TaxID=2585769 RepID=UPI001E292DC8|nr:hypothetical protein [Psychrobacter sp. I-STPA10]